jgi:hypothetical protein
MLIRNNQHMSGYVRIEIQRNESVNTPSNHKVGFIVSRLSCQPTEDACR